jgi:hypothetical protein
MKTDLHLAASIHVPFKLFYHESLHLWSVREAGDFRLLIHGLARTSNVTRKERLNLVPDDLAQNRKENDSSGDFDSVKFYKGNEAGGALSAMDLIFRVAAPSRFFEGAKVLNFLRPYFRSILIPRFGSMMRFEHYDF